MTGSPTPSPAGGPRSVSARLLVGAAVSSLGTGVFTACATVFFVGTVRLRADQVGVALSVGAGLGLACGGPIGRLADRHPLRRVLVVVVLGRGFAYGGLGLVDGLPGYAVLVCLGLIGDQVTPALQQAFVGRLVPGPARTVLLGRLRAVRNVGLTAGLLVGALLLSSDDGWPVRAGLLANGLSFAVLAALLAGLPDPSAPAAPEASPAADPAADPAGDPAGDACSGGVRSPWRDRRFLVVCAGNGLLLLHDTVLFVLLPLWVVERGTLPAAAVPVLFAVNTVLTVALQLWLPTLASAASWRPGIVTSTVLLVPACAALLAAETLPDGALPVVPALAWAVLGVVLLTVAENVHSLAAWELSYALAPAPRAAEYLSVFGLGLGVQALIGPGLVSLVVLPLHGLGWVLLAVVFASAGTAVLLVGPRSLTGPGTVRRDDGSRRRDDGARAGHGRWRGPAGQTAGGGAGGGDQHAVPDVDPAESPRGRRTPPRGRAAR
jgi:hypothetical protein